MLLFLLLLFLFLSGLHTITFILFRYALDFVIISSIIFTFLNKFLLVVGSFLIDFLILSKTFAHQAHH